MISNIDAIELSTIAVTRTSILIALLIGTRTDRCFGGFGKASDFRVVVYSNQSNIAARDTAGRGGVR